MAYDNTNSGFMGKNDRKEKDSHPDIKGSINVEGKEYWLSGWKNSKGYGLKIKPKEHAAAKTAKQQVAKATDGFEDSEIPL